VIRRLTSALIVATAIVAAVGFASPAQASAAGTFVAQINAERARAGRAPFAQRGDLASVALRHAQKMATQNSLHHNGNLGGQIGNWRAVGENVGMGGNTRTLHAAFMNSPAHRANIMDSDYTEIGVGVSTDTRGIMWVTEVFRQPLRATVRTPVRAVARPSSTGTPTDAASRAPAALRVAAQKAATAKRAAAKQAAAKRVAAKRITAKRAAAKGAVAKRPASRKRIATKTPAVRWASRSRASTSGSTTGSAWLDRLSSAAAANTTAPSGALTQAVDYLHVVAG